jgi:hypothetical protein
MPGMFRIGVALGGDIAMPGIPGIAVAEGIGLGVDFAVGIVMPGILDITVAEGLGLGVDVAVGIAMPGICCDLAVAGAIATNSTTMKR